MIQETGDRRQETEWTEEAYKLICPTAPSRRAALAQDLDWEDSLNHSGVKKQQCWSRIRLCVFRFVLILWTEPNCRFWFCSDLDLLRSCKYVLF